MRLLPFSASVGEDFSLLCDIRKEKRLLCVISERKNYPPVVALGLRHPEVPFLGSEPSLYPCFARIVWPHQGATGCYLLFCPGLLGME